MTEIIDVTGKLVINHKARDWCKLPYPDHPNGCINYGNSPDCPPEAPLIEDWLDLDKTHWFIVTKFDRGEFARELNKRRLKEKKSKLTEKQARCCLYWQGTVRKELKRVIKICLTGTPDRIFTLCPEGMGINVMATARKVKIPIETKPKDIIYKIALVGFPKIKRKTLFDF